MSVEATTEPQLRVETSPAEDKDQILALTSLLLRSASLLGVRHEK